MLKHELHRRITQRSRRAICLLVAAFMAFSLVGSTLLSAPATALAAGATTTDYLNLRSGPGYGYSVLTVMPAGSALTVTGDPQNGFYPVSYQGRDGWALGDYLSIQGSSSGNGGSAVTTDWLNLRAGPSLGAQVLMVMPPGASVALTGGSQNGFAAVSYSGRVGWASSAYLKTGAAGSANTSSANSVSASGSWITTTDLNLRAGPSLGDKVLTVMPGGSSVTVTGAAQNGFYPVNFQGTSGWAYGDYLRQSGGQSQSNSGGSSGSSGSTTSAPASGSYTTQQIIDIIYAAADKYGQSRDDMLRVARCESNLNPRAVGGGSYGLFQFTKGTWATTPYGNDDIFDPTANANAAGWMWSVGRRGEWVCQ